jgi:hypothetical protein
MVSGHRDQQQQQQRILRQVGELIRRVAAGDAAVAQAADDAARANERIRAAENAAAAARTEAATLMGKLRAAIAEFEAKGAAFQAAVWRAEAEARDAKTALAAERAAFQADLDAAVARVAHAEAATRTVEARLELEKIEANAAVQQKHAPSSPSVLPGSATKQSPPVVRTEDDDLLRRPSHTLPISAQQLEQSRRMSPLVVADVGVQCHLVSRRELLLRREQQETTDFAVASRAKGGVDGTDVGASRDSSSVAAPRRHRSLDETRAAVAMPTTWATAWFERASDLLHVYTARVATYAMASAAAAATRVAEVAAKIDEDETKERTLAHEGRRRAEAQTRHLRRQLEETHADVEDLVDAVVRWVNGAFLASHQQRLHVVDAALDAASVVCHVPPPPPLAVRKAPKNQQASAGDALSAEKLLRGSHLPVAARRTGPFPIPGVLPQPGGDRDSPPSSVPLRGAGADVSASGALIRAVDKGQLRTAYVREVRSGSAISLTTPVDAGSQDETVENTAPSGPPAPAPRVDLLTARRMAAAARRGAQSSDHSPVGSRDTVAATRVVGNSETRAMTDGAQGAGGVIVTSQADAASPPQPPLPLPQQRMVAAASAVAASSGDIVSLLAAATATATATTTSRAAAPTVPVPSEGLAIIADAALAPTAVQGGDDFAANAPAGAIEAAPTAADRTRPEITQEEEEEDLIVMEVLDSMLEAHRDPHQRTMTPHLDTDFHGTNAGTTTMVTRDHVNGSVSDHPALPFKNSPTAARARGLFTQMQLRAAAASLAEAHRGATARMHRSSSAASLLLAAASSKTSTTTGAAAGSGAPVVGATEAVTTMTSRTAASAMPGGGDRGHNEDGLGAPSGGGLLLLSKNSTGVAPPAVRAAFRSMPPDTTLSRTHQLDSFLTKGEGEDAWDTTRYRTSNQWPVVLPNPIPVATTVPPAAAKVVWVEGHPPLEHSDRLRVTAARREEARLRRVVEEENPTRRNHPARTPPPPSLSSPLHPSSGTQQHTPRETLIDVDGRIFVVPVAAPAVAGTPHRPEDESGSTPLLHSARRAQARQQQQHQKASAAAAVAAATAPVVAGGLLEIMSNDAGTVDDDEESDVNTEGGGGSRVNSSAGSRQPDSVADSLGASLSLSAREGAVVATRTLASTPSASPPRLSTPNHPRGVSSVGNGSSLPPQRRAAAVVTAKARPSSLSRRPRAPPNTTPVRSSDRTMQRRRPQEDGGARVAGIPRASDRVAPRVSPTAPSAARSNASDELARQSASGLEDDGGRADSLAEAHAALLYGHTPSPLRRATADDNDSLDRRGRVDGGGWVGGTNQHHSDSPAPAFATLYETVPAGAHAVTDGAEQLQHRSLSTPPPPSTGDASENIFGGDSSTAVAPGGPVLCRSPIVRHL